jgi:hypothetical protein
MEAAMVKSQTIIKHRLIMLFVLAIASVIFTGCDNGSLGIKTGAIKGYIIDSDTNQPISEVFIKASGGLDEAENKSTYSGGDGSFIFGDVNKGKWSISVEKYGYTRALEDNEESNVSCTIANGETIVLSPIKLAKVASGTKGILKGYPIDSITGRALTNFTVNQNTPYNQRKTKTFDSAATFRDTGWTGLEGGLHEYIITANNYKPFSTNSIESFNEGVNIGKSVADLGTIQMEPLTVDISGTFRNVPGYAMGENKSIVVWAEAAGKVVASYTELDAESSKGTITYVLSGVPVTAGSVCVKCKVKGYDVITINSAVSITTANPGGVIAGVDVDFGVQEPIVADLRVIVLGNKDESDSPSTFKTNEVARVYVRSGGKDVVPYVDVTSVNYGGEVTIANVITGYPISIIVVNQDRKFCAYREAEEFTIPEGTDVYPYTVTLEEQ